MPEVERTALYRLYDADDRLLYVGISSMPRTRWQQHASSKDWWPDVATREVEWHETRVGAAAAEAEAIRAEKPAHNRMHNVAPTELLGLLPVIENVPLRPSLKRVERDSRPASQRAAADLRALIMSGDAPLGSKLPTTAEFIEQYRISNVTVQRALATLKEEGLAVGRFGVGVYVTSPTPEHLGDPEVHEVAVTIAGEARPPRRVASALGVGDSVLVWREEAVVEVDGWPVRLITTYRRDSKTTPIPSAHVDYLSVRLPTSAELIALSLPDEVPVMCTFRLGQDSSGSVVEVHSLVEPGHMCQRRYTTPLQ
ncbi:GntR family transcriptional regulator [Streptomyces sp. NPDC001404]|uniref:GntR family transcriptional regulator n=1 Tax=Streptomyces sp. NPDC001404 TaxID=3364571 RepID=UPI0036BDE8B7